MKLTVNGDPYDHQGDTTLKSLLRELDADHARVAVVINDDVIGRVNHDAVKLKPGDCIEILTFAGGG